MRQMLYHLNHTSSSVHSGYSGDGVLLFAQASLDLDPPDLGYLHSLGWQAKLFIEMGSSKFLPWWALNCCSPDLSTPGRITDVTY
jgi:hypothetical protein